MRLDSTTALRHHMLPTSFHLCIPPYLHPRTVSWCARQQAGISSLKQAIRSGLLALRLRSSRGSTERKRFRKESKQQPLHRTPPDRECAFIISWPPMQAQICGPSRINSDREVAVCFSSFNSSACASPHRHHLISHTARKLARKQRRSIDNCSTLEKTA
jgi:hypothetical protein